MLGCIYGAEKSMLSKSGRSSTFIPPAAAAPGYRIPIDPPCGCGGGPPGVITGLLSSKRGKGGSMPIVIEFSVAGMSFYMYATRRSAT